MKIIALFILIMTNSWAGEVKVQLEKESVFTGEIILGKALNYSGPDISEKKLGTDLYILELKEDKVKMVFIKKPSANIVALNETDYLVWNPIEVIEVKKAEAVFLSPQDFIIKTYGWLIYWILGFLVIVFLLFFYHKKVKPKRLSIQKIKSIKSRLFAADELTEITAVWKDKYLFIENFPFLEEEFNKFEAIFYQFAFKPKMTEEEAKEIKKAYSHFLESIRGGNFGI